MSQNSKNNVINLDSFKTYLLDNNRKPITIKKHLFWVSRVIGMCPNYSVEEINAYLDGKKKQGNNNNSINVIIESIRCYAQFLQRQDVLNSIKYLKRDTSFERGILSPEEVNKLLKLRRSKNMWKQSWNMYMMAIRIMLWTGLRPRETCTLSVDDIDFGLGVIKLKPENAKTNGTIPIPDTLYPHLKKYIDNTTTQLLFPSIKGGYEGHIGVNALDEFWRKVLKRVGIKRTNVTPYSCRHTFGTELGSADVNMKTIKELMRHTKITTTEIYLHPSLKTLKKAQIKIPYISKTADPLAKLQIWVETIEALEISKDSRFNYTFTKTEDSLSLQIKKKI